MTTKKNMRMLALFGKNIQQKNGTLPPCGLIKDFREMGTADRKKDLGQPVTVTTG